MSVKQPITGCWYYDHNVCGLPHPSPLKEKYDNQMREEGAKAERERMLCLSDKDKERIAAAMAVATYCSGIPEVFDTIQLNCKVPKETAASYAKAMLVIMDDYPGWCELIERLSQHTNENISLHSSEQERDP